MTNLYPLLITAALALIALTGCDALNGTSDSISLEPTGNIAERSYDITGFDRVQASHTFDLIVTQGDDFSVALTVDESAVEYLDVRKSGDTLLLTLDSDNNYSIDGDLTLIATITMPALHEVQLSGASTAEIRGFEAGEPLEVQVSGASMLAGAVETGDVTLQLSGSSRVQLTGSGGNITLQASGASVATLEEFEAQNASVEASGSSRVSVNLRGTLDVDASGASEVLYSGDVTLGEIETSGSSVVDAG